MYAQSGLEAWRVNFGIEDQAFVALMSVIEKILSTQSITDTAAPSSLGHSTIFANYGTFGNSGLNRLSGEESNRYSISHSTIWKPPMQTEFEKQLCEQTVADVQKAFNKLSSQMYEGTGRYIPNFHEDAPPNIAQPAEETRFSAGAGPGDAGYLPNFCEDAPPDITQPAEEARFSAGAGLGDGGYPPTFYEEARISADIRLGNAKVEGHNQLLHQSMSIEEDGLGIDPRSTCIESYDTGSSHHEKHLPPSLPLLSQQPPSHVPPQRETSLLRLPTPPEYAPREMSLLPAVPPQVLYSNPQSSVKRKFAETAKETDGDEAELPPLLLPWLSGIVKCTKHPRWKKPGKLRQSCIRCKRNELQV